MLQDSATISGYLVELFETPGDDVIADDALGREELHQSLENIIRGFGRGARAFLVPPVGRTPVIEFQLTRDDAPALIENRSGFNSIALSDRKEPAELDFNEERHDVVLSQLVKHPLVRTIRPPVQIGLADDNTPTSNSGSVNIPSPSPGGNYPIIGVIDSGVSDILSEWLVGRFDFLDTDEYNAEHGTKVGGLIAAGQTMNPANVVLEPTGCMLYDAALFPKGRFVDTYANGFTDFMEEVEQAVIEAKEEHSVRTVSYTHLTLPTILLV